MDNNAIHLKSGIKPTPYCIVSHTAYTGQHLHPHIEIAHIVKGRYIYSIEEETFELQAGDIFFLPPYTLHSFQVQTEEYERLIVTISAEDLGLISALFQNIRLSSYVIRKDQLDPVLPNRELTIRELYWKLHNKNPLRRLNAYNDLVNLCCRLAEIVGTTKVPQAKNDLCKKALDICNAGFNQTDFTASKVAEALFVSRSHIEQLFMRQMHISIKKYIILMRVNYAESLLRETDQPINAISREAGFGSVRTFNRLFYEHKHMTPQEWKNAHRK